MLLKARLLSDVQSVNSWEITDQVNFTQGDTLTIYMQIVDASLDTPQQGFNPAGRRYMPAAGATLSCVIDNLNDAVKVTRFATQPFAQDQSVWALTMLASDPTPAGTAAIRLTLTEGAKVTSGIVLAALGIATQLDG